MNEVNECLALSLDERGLHSEANMIRYLDAENARLRAALDMARREIVTLTEAAVNRLRDYGCDVDPAERTYQPVLDRIEAATVTPNAA